MKKKLTKKTINAIESSLSNDHNKLDLEELKKNTKLLIESYKKLSRKTEEQKKIHNRLAFHDSLCQIFNRRKFGQMLASEINRAVRYKTKFSVIMFDLDKFKVINDSFGHEAGDLVLKKTADAVSKNIRSNDIFARWGGDEFIILAPGTSSQNAAVLAEKLRAIIATLTVGDYPQFTGSFGIAEYLQGDTIKGILVRADICLYKAKNSGRNKVCSNIDDKYSSVDNLTLSKVSLPKEIKHLKQLTYKIDMMVNEKSLHNLVVAGYAEGIAKAAGIKDKNLISNIKTAGLLHDVGKICIPFTIIAKTDPLTDEERKILQKHSEFSAKITNNILNNNEISEIILAHHERYDGSGYPKGLKGNEIPLGARILSIADTFHVVLFGRIYQKSASITDAVKEIEKNSGLQFDPHYVSAFKKWVKNEFKEKD